MLELTVGGDLTVEGHQFFSAAVDLAQHAQADSTYCDEQHHDGEEGRNELGVNSGRHSCDQSRQPVCHGGLLLRASNRDAPDTAFRRKSPLSPPFCKGGKCKARGDLRESAVSFAILLQALKNPYHHPFRLLTSIPSAPSSAH